ncbi:hypothetical protein BGZ73_003604 [Actinomortierella ambigua]|nr:hypothetical protein BGZ73_003604 [Actinomortierella ambigua]
MVNMVTTQFDVLLFVGERQLVSCSVFVPVPSIVVKSHNVITNNILPALPPLERIPLPFPFSILRRPTPKQPALPAPSDCSQLVATTPLGYPAIAPPPTTTALTTVSTNTSNNNGAYRPDPGTACLKISLRPKPSFKFLRVHHYTIMSYEEEQHYFINRPIRLMPQLFTYPFSPDTSSDCSDHAPSAVVVTGNFDQWQRTVRLKENKGMHRWEGLVDVNIDQLVSLGDQHRKLLYKFILDGQHWVTDPNQPLERDSEGNLNNFRLLDIEERFGTQHSGMEAQQQQQDAPHQPQEYDKGEKVTELVIDDRFETAPTPTVAPVPVIEEEEKDVHVFQHLATHEQAQTPCHHPQSHGEGDAQETGSDSNTESPSDNSLPSHPKLEEHKGIHMPTHQEEPQPETTVGVLEGVSAEDIPQSPPQPEKVEAVNALDVAEQDQQYISHDSGHQADQSFYSTPSAATASVARETELSTITPFSTQTLLVGNSELVKDPSVSVREALMEAPVMPTSATPTTVASSPVLAETDAGPQTTRKRNTSSLLTFSTNPDEHDGDGDYGVVVLQGELITASTTNLLASRKAPPPPLLPTPPSSASTTYTTASIRLRAESLQQAPPSPAASATTATSTKTMATTPTTPTTTTTTLCGRHDAIEAAEDPTPHRRDANTSNVKMALTPLHNMPGMDSSNMVAEASHAGKGSSSKAPKLKKKKTTLWKKIKKALS